MHEDLVNALEAYATAREELVRLRMKHFPVGSLATVDGRQGPVGKVVECGESPGLVSILFENGNTWSFPMVRVSLVECPDQTKSKEGCHLCRHVGGCPNPK